MYRKSDNVFHSSYQNLDSHGSSYYCIAEYFHKHSWIVGILRRKVNIVGRLPMQLKTLYFIQPLFLLQTLSGRAKNT